jgi:hypothetical protein
MGEENSKLPMTRSAGLVDVLDRILDKGLIVAGDVKISLADVELLTIRIRLIICSVDKAEKIGMDWWRADPYFSSFARQRAAEVAGATEDARRLEAKVADLDAKLAALLRGAQKDLPAPGAGGEAAKG